MEGMLRSLCKKSMWSERLLQVESAAVSQDHFCLILAQEQLLEEEMRNE